MFREIWELVQKRIEFEKSKKFQTGKDLFKQGKTAFDIIRAFGIDDPLLLRRLVLIGERAEPISNVIIQEVLGYLIFVRPKIVIYCQKMDSNDTGRVGMIFRSRIGHYKIELFSEKKFDNLFICQNNPEDRWLGFCKVLYPARVIDNQGKDNQSMVGITPNQWDKIKNAMEASFKE